MNEPDYVTPFLINDEHWEPVSYEGSDEKQNFKEEAYDVVGKELPSDYLEDLKGDPRVEYLETNTWNGISLATTIMFRAEDKEYLLHVTEREGSHIFDINRWTLSHWDSP